MAGKRSLAAIFLLCLALPGGIVLLISAQAQASGQAQIAFASKRDGNWEIYVMDARGGNIRRLTDNPTTADFEATWSPDGRKIAFRSGRDLYIMDASGRNRHRLIDDPASDREPAWSPDGRQIAFSSNRGGGQPGNWGMGDIYVIDIDGKNLRNLTNNLSWNHHSPTWSPDGRKIAFSANRNNAIGIYVIDVDLDVDGKVRMFSRGPFQDRDPAWSPDGRWIACASGVTRDRTDISLLNAANGKRTEFEKPTNGHLIHNGVPSWSPDGREIVFASTRDGNAEIYVMDVDGENLRRLTNHPETDHLPVWRPVAPNSVYPAEKYITSWGWVKRIFK